ncbi:TetR/AcrR family transcriptional regulator [Microlunatus sp. GCM10028923]|uniref:TetR/AcrR family transcriptional regulator n=1 Tax=Microlunatus sp. GCM10028923 TaxID=3273400 RepID=UPI00361B9807
MPSNEPTPPVSRQRADAVRNRARVLAAAEEVFDRSGPTASTAEIARVAGVGVGTVFRHFPTKRDLLSAIVKDRWVRVAELAERMNEGDDPDAFFTFFGDLVAIAAGRKSVVDALALEGVDLSVDKPIGSLQAMITPLLDRAKDAGRVRRDIEVPEVMALLIGTCQAALSAGWSAELRDRTTKIIFDGLRHR